MRSEKRVCVLTGASGTLGVDFCRRWAGTYDIVAVYRSQVPEVPSQLQHLIDPLDPSRALPENEDAVFTVRADLLEPGGIERVVELALARFEAVDLLVNAAAFPVWAPMLDGTRLVDTALAQIHLNAVVPLQLAVAIAQEFWRDRADENRLMNRNVVNLSSIAGVNIYTDLGQSVYSASKAALNYLTYHMASEFTRFGVRVNAIAPNSFPEIVPVEDVSGAIVEFDGGEANGQVLVLDARGRYVL